MMRLHPIALIFSIFVAAACPASAGSHTMNAEEMKLFRLATNDREQLRPEAKLDPILCRVARKRAADMVRRDYFGHVNPSGKAAATTSGSR